MQPLTPLIAGAAGPHHGWHHGCWWIVFSIIVLLVAAFVTALFWRRGRGPSDGGDSPP